MSQALVILCTCPDSPTALELARGLVSNQLAACVNVLPGIRSIYRWQERIEDEDEEPHGDENEGQAKNEQDGPDQRVDDPEEERREGQSGKTGVLDAGHDPGGTEPRQGR